MSPSRSNRPSRAPTSPYQAPQPHRTSPATAPSAAPARPAARPRCRNRLRVRGPILDSYNRAPARRGRLLKLPGGAIRTQPYLRPLNRLRSPLCSPQQFAFVGAFIRRTAVAVGRTYLLPPFPTATTEDGGAHWQPQTSGTPRNLLGVQFTADGRCGWVVGDRGTGEQ